MTASQHPEIFPPLIEAGPPGPFLFVCEHASPHIPASLEYLGLPESLRLAHIAWDPGALSLARGLLARLGGRCVSATVSRLVHDANRSPDQPSAMPETGEGQPIPGNRGLDPDAREARVRCAYLPFHEGVMREVAFALGRGTSPVLVTVHSFTPTWFGVPRHVELGIIHDADDRLATSVLAAACRLTKLKAEMNAPYSAADGVTHTLRAHALPFGLPNVMLEVRNDLLETPAQVDAMAGMLAEALSDGLHALRERAA